ncbi:hypothetical protein COHA_003683 [Chlorella ohadii]|uniref:Glutathione S-transferase n=1 Tax=Chlorella ohadii TaxID=2649997 RepID=A0AAD5DY84_9CHLO|nr:hypothetical protein COHA_003683 [Chlorella ohadii]
MAAAAKRVHFDSTTCPYAQRSWVALIEKGLDFEIRKVDLQNKDAEFVSTYHSINPNEEAPAKVPILLDGDVRLVESGVIVDYLNKRYPEPPLEPADAAAAAKARLFIELFNSHFTGNMFGLYSTETKEQVEQARAKLAAGIKVLDSTLRLHGSEEGGDYFLGGFYSVAEVFTTGFVQRGLASLKEYRGVDLAELVKEVGADRFERWMHAALARPSAQQTKPADDVIVEGLRKYVAPFKS